MAVAAVPAPPTLAAARPRTARAHPLTARRAHPTPTGRRQPPARFQDAPIRCTCRGTCSPWTHPHALHSAHCLAARANTRAAAAVRRRQQRRQQRQQQQQRQRRSRQTWQFAMGFNGSIQQSQLSSLGIGIKFASSIWSSIVPADASQWLQSASSVGRVSLDGRDSACGMGVMSCAMCLCQCHSGSLCSAFSAHGRLHIDMAACSIQQAGCVLCLASQSWQPLQPRQPREAGCDVLCAVSPDPGGGIQIS